VRVKEEWLNPRGRQLCARREADIESRRANNWRLRRVVITTRCDQCDRAYVITAIRVPVNTAVQSRRKADQERPAKSCKQNAGNKSSRASLWTPWAVHWHRSLWR